MSYKIRSYDANHATYVNYTIGSLRLSELTAITAGDKYDSDGNRWTYAVNYSASDGRKITITRGVGTLDGILKGLHTTGLPSLSLGNNMVDYGFEYVMRLQKNPTSTVEYPNMTISNTVQSQSGGITYYRLAIEPRNNNTSGTSLFPAVTARSDYQTQQFSYYTTPLLITDANDEPLYLGGLTMLINSRYSSCEIQISYNKNALYSAFSSILTVTNNNDPLEGDFSYDFEGDEIELPGAPDETVSGVLASGFLNIYRPSDAQLQAFGAALWTNLFNTKWYDKDNVANLILNAVSDPINFIVGLFMLPVSPDVGANSGIFLGGINVNTVSAPKVAAQFKTIDFGTINIDELYGNYLDYSHSQLSIYLPYVGVADIDVQEVNGGSITLRYTIDCFTGACVANVKCIKYTKTPWGKTYKNSTVHSYTGNVAIQLPISAGSFDTMLSGLISVGLGLGMNQPAKALQGVGDMISGMAGDVTTRGSLSSNTGKCCYQTPYLMFTRPIEVRPKNLGNVHGYSAGAGGVLSSFSGFVECSDIKLDGVVATTTELDELRRLCSEGVYV